VGRLFVFVSALQIAPAAPVSFFVSTTCAKEVILRIKVELKSAFEKYVISFLVKRRVIHAAF
jgi:hypothetical protein